MSKRRPAHDDPRDASARHRAVQLAAYVFDFGQLGHAIECTCAGLRTLQAPRRRIGVDHYVMRQIADETRQLLATRVAHDLDHIVQIARVLGCQYSDEVGPWRAYLRVISGVQG